jgi:hypothetical protein
LKIQANRRDDSEKNRLSQMVCAEVSTQMGSRLDAECNIEINRAASGEIATESIR